MKIRDDLRIILNNPRVQNWINVGNWKKLYNYFNSKPVYLDASSIGEFTSIVLKIGVNPLENLDYIPEYFLANADIQNFIIPKNIKAIDARAFENCTNLEQILIPDNVENIKTEAFYGCTNLSKLVLGRNVNKVYDRAFSNTPNLKDIEYKGTILELNQIEIYPNNTGLINKIIKCADGITYLTLK